MSHVDPEDVVVAELDVVVSNELASLATQLVMLQQPLRPNWRPYNSDRSGVTARFKPQARRLEMSLPLDTSGENYGDADENKRITALTLRSTAVDDSGASYAVGVVRDNQLLLLPLDYTLQLRPNMSFLNADSKSKKDGEESEEEEPADEPMTAVEVTVKRRETERQQQARLNSYSHLQQEEQQEAWIPLQLHAPDSTPADAIWHKLLSDAAAATGPNSSDDAAAAGQQRPVPPALSRVEYLRSFVPSCAPAAADVLGANGTAAMAGAGSSAAAAAGGAAGAAAAAADASSPELALAMGPIIQQLVSRHPVCSMANVRQWLQQAAESEPLARQAAQLTDPLLDSVVQATGHVLLIRRMYVAKVGNNTQLEGLRKVVVTLMAEKPTLRKADVFGAAEAAGLSPTESQYQRVMRELCRNNGNHWTIKTSADM